MTRYIFNSTNDNFIISGKIYTFSTPKTLRYLLEVDQNAILLNCILNKFIKKFKKFIKIIKKYKSLKYLRARELGLKKFK